MTLGCYSRWKIVKTKQKKQLNLENNFKENQEAYQTYEAKISLGSTWNISTKILLIFFTGL